MADGDAADHDLAVGDGEFAAHHRVEAGEDRLRAGVQPVALRRDQDALDEHAEIEPGADLEIAVDRHHQRDRRVEEAQIGGGLALHAVDIALLDAEQAVEVPADLAAARLVGLAEGLGIVAVFLGRRQVRAVERRDQRRLEPRPRLRADDPHAARAACWCRSAIARRPRADGAPAPDRPGRAGRRGPRGG